MNDFFSVKIRLSGVNLNKVYKECLKNSIVLKNVNRVEYKILEFEVENKYIKFIKKLAKQHNLKFEIIKHFGLQKILSFLLSRTGLCVGISLIFLSIIVSTQFVWNVKIYGTERVETAEIMSILQSNGIGNGKIVNSNKLDTIEQEILNNIDNISLCSVIKKGSTIIVNIKEKIYSEELEKDKTSDIIATDNITINSISIVQGTPLFKAGDSVKKGEIIVAGYFMDANGNRVECNAKAKINASLWISTTENYLKKREVLTETGNIIKNSTITLFGKSYSVKSAENTYSCFKTETKTTSLTKNNFFPLYLTTTTYFECERTYVEQSFNADKEDFFKRLREKNLKKLPENAIIKQCFETVNEFGDYYAVTSYAEVEIDL